MEVIKLKTPKGKNVEIPLSESDIEKPRLTIIKNGKKLYAPLVKEKPDKKEEFIIVRTTDGINYYVGEQQQKEDIIPSGEKELYWKYQFNYDENHNTFEKSGKLNATFEVPENIKVLKIESYQVKNDKSEQCGLDLYIKVKPKQKLLFKGSVYQKDLGYIPALLASYSINKKNSYITKNTYDTTYIKILWSKDINEYSEWKKDMDFDVSDTGDMTDTGDSGSNIVGGGSEGDDIGDENDY